MPSLLTLARTKAVAPTPHRLDYACLATAIFGFFAFMMILQLIWVCIMVPETKGISLEQMEEKLGKK
ncbi:MAG: sugar porter family MFS transporter [Akkermansiaceae bacterium]|nr:sugar porter family MFS transporter [Akkermansiaceae bacterium]